jgi:hypothetical protein
VSIEEARRGSAVRDDLHALARSRTKCEPLRVGGWERSLTLRIKAFMRQGGNLV